MEPVGTVRVIYGDTDAAGIVYYGQYLRWFEVGRAELMRRKGLVYRDLNEVSIHLPVIEAHADYRHPARYDDVLRIFAQVREFRGVRIAFGYRIEREDGLELVTGHTVHAFTDGQGRVVRPPREYRERLGGGTGTD